MNDLQMVLEKMSKEAKEQFTNEHDFDEVEARANADRERAYKEFLHDLFQED